MSGIEHQPAAAVPRRRSAGPRAWLFPPRAVWLRRLHQWHWVSSAVCLAGLLLFSFTGFTLNHAGSIAATPAITTLEAELPPSVRSAVDRLPETGQQALPAALRGWLADHWSLPISGAEADISASEVYLALPEPGGDAWLAVDRITGSVIYEHTDRGWIAWLNDLHKGRNTGPAWRLFIDVFAFAALVFAGTGLVLLYLHARHRPATWPVTLAGLILPWLLLVFFVH